MIKTRKIKFFKFNLLLLFLNITSFTFAQYETPKFSNDVEIVKHHGFTLSYSELHEQPLWVAYELDAKKTQGKIKRSNKFKIDPSISTGSATLADYKGSGYDRGHLAPAGDMKWSKKAMDDSFYMSNISPQVPGFNRGIWKKLEFLVRKWAVENEKIYIATGPIFRDNPNSIGHSKVTIPSAYYKVVLDYTEPEFKAIGFILPNLKSKEHLSTYVYTIDKIESILGVDFFHKLDDNIEDLIESDYNLSSWGM